MRTKRFIIILIVLMLLFALPASALAGKRIYKARLTTGAELHDVVGSDARGAAVFRTTPTGLAFQMQVRGLSGAPWGAHIHGPATTSENGPVLVTLCGAPAPGAVGTCSFDTSTNTMFVEGVIGSSLLAQWGLKGSTLLDYFDDGLAYVNVHTDLNPAGEVRGQVIGQ